MAGLSNPRLVFGVHSITPYKRSDGTYYGTAKVIGSFDASFQGELIEQVGGSNPYPFGVERGLIKSDLKIQFKEYADWMFQLFLGHLPTEVGVDSSGTISTLTNKLGTSVKSATTGITSITVTSGAKADLKFSKYIVVAADSTHVNVYAATDADFGRGTVETYIDDTLKINASPLVVTASTATSIAGFGLDINGGSGTIGLTAGDTATFEVLPPSTKSMSVVIGGTSDVFPEFGCIAIAQKLGSGELLELDLFRCIGVGLPISFKEKAYSDAQVTAKALYDSTQNGVYKIRNITP